MRYKTCRVNTLIHFTINYPHEHAVPFLFEEGYKCPMIPVGFILPNGERYLNCVQVHKVHVP